MQSLIKPTLLFDDECGVCRCIAGWVQKSVKSKSGEMSIVVRPIGNDPEALQALNPDLNIWDAYATIHLLMPDGSMRLGGEAVGEVLRNIPITKWFAWSFAISIFGFRPFQTLLNLAYSILSHIRPIFGCESCGTPNFWVRPIAGFVKRVKALFSENHPPNEIKHSTPIETHRAGALPVSGKSTPRAAK